VLLLCWQTVRLLRCAAAAHHRSPQPPAAAAPHQTAGSRQQGEQVDMHCASRGCWLQVLHVKPVALKTA
jgi:hypothetical protein